MLCIRSLFLAFLCRNFLNELYDLQVCIKRQMDRLHHQRVRDFVRTRLNHHDFVLFGGNRQGKACIFPLFCRRVYNQLPIAIADIYRRNRVSKRDVRNVQREGRANHRQHLRRAVLVNGHNRCHDCHIVPVILREQRAQRSVDASCRQHSFLRRAALSLNEPAGNFPHGIQSFFIVNA